MNVSNARHALAPSSVKEPVRGSLQSTTYSSYPAELPSYNDPIEDGQFFGSRFDKIFSSIRVLSKITTLQQERSGFQVTFVNEEVGPQPRTGPDENQTEENQEEEAAKKSLLNSHRGKNRYSEIDQHLADRLTKALFDISQAHSELRSDPQRREFCSWEALSNRLTPPDTSHNLGEQEMGKHRKGKEKEVTFRSSLAGSQAIQRGSLDHGENSNHSESAPASTVVQICGPTEGTNTSVSQTFSQDILTLLEIERKLRGSIQRHTGWPDVDDYLELNNHLHELNETIEHMKSRQAVALYNGSLTASQRPIPVDEFDEAGWTSFGSIIKFWSRRSILRKSLKRAQRFQGSQSDFVVIGPPGTESSSTNVLPDREEVPLVIGGQEDDDNGGPAEQ